MFLFLQDMKSRIKSVENKVDILTKRLGLFPERNSVACFFKLTDIRGWSLPVAKKYRRASDPNLVGY